MLKNAIFSIAHILTCVKRQVAMIEGQNTAII